MLDCHSFVYLFYKNYEIKKACHSRKSFPGMTSKNVCAHLFKVSLDYNQITPAYFIVTLSR